MFTYKNLMTVGCAAVLAIGLAACGSSSDDDDTAMDTTTTPTTPAQPAQPVAVSGDVTLPMAAQAAFGILMNPGDSDAVEIAAEQAVVRQGVTFTCASAYPCTVTVTNNLGTIVATWMSYTLDDGTAGVMASVPVPPAHTFAAANSANPATVRAALGTPIAALGGAVGNPNTAIGGMRLGDSGALNFNGFTLTSNLNPNGTAFAVGPPVAGSTLTAGLTNDEIMPSPDMAPPPAGWQVKALFRDWGDDTTSAADGGFETSALAYSDIGPGTPQPFDAMLAARFVNAGASYAFTVLANGTPPAAPPAATSVNIPVALPGGPSVLTMAMVFDPGSLVPAQDQDLNIDPFETFTGSYFGARGVFQCAVAGCGLMRNADGTVGLADTGAAAGLQSGTWTFTPAPGAIITVPDQDWMIYGAWMTTPDDSNGTHALGVFFNGFDPYEGIVNGNDAFTAGATGLNGTATYSGGAAGIYVDDMTSSGFTASATLTANFDVDGDGMAGGAGNDANDYMISGRIDDFRGQDGTFLGSDTAAMPNDPVRGGENDWVVTLGMAPLAAGANGAIPVTATAGSADGIPWVGTWSGQLYGPNVDAMMNPVSPSGVAGQFRAATVASGNAQVGNTSVVGAFGATRD